MENQTTLHQDDEDDEQYNDALRRRNYIIATMKNYIYMKIIYLKKRRLNNQGINQGLRQKLSVM